MNTIYFENIARVPGKVTFDVRYEGGEDQIYFELPENIRPKYTEIAVAMATMAGQSFEEIHMDLPVDPLARVLIERWTKAKLVCSGEEIYNRITGDNVLLTFSGGFDSLAAKSLIPEDALLTSSRFLGNYEKEWEFFKDFDTGIVTTNMRDHGYNLNSDAFMSAGACLLKSSLGAEYLVSGDIYEAYFVSVEPELKTKEIFRALGFTPARYMEALTEVGTTMVCACFSPKLMERSLASLASPGTEKYHRKTNLIRIIRSRFRGNLPEIPVVRCETPVPFGQQFYSDFLSLYELKYLGWQEAEARVSGIPEEAVQMAEKLKLDFYERINPDALTGFRNDKDRQYYLARAKEAGLSLYDENDFRELKAVEDFLFRNRDRYIANMNGKLDRQKERLYAKYIARKKKEERQRLQESVEELEAGSFAKPSGCQVLPAENEYIEIDAGESNFRYCSILNKVRPGIYELEFEDIELSGTDCFTVSVYNTNPKLRVLEKTFTAEKSCGTVLKIANSENMRILVYPNVPGATKDCRIKVKVKTFRYWKEESR